MWMTPDALIVIFLLVVAVFLFSTERIPVDMTALLILSALMLSGVLSPSEGIAGFSNEATITIAAMFVLSTGLYKSGALSIVAKAMIRIGKRDFRLFLLSLMIGIGVMSAFILNTAVVAIFLPIAVDVAREVKVSPSRVLMPLSFASILGGMCSLIGTSTNIIVDSIARRHGQAPLRMFEFTEMGAPMFIVGVLYMLFLGIRLIPSRRGAEQLTENFGLDDYLVEIVLLPEAKSVGKALADSPLVREMDLDILDVIRNGERLWPTRDFVLQANDLLHVRGDVKQIRTLQERVGILLKPGRRLEDHDLETSQATLVEAVVAPGSWLVGKSLQEVDFRNRFGAIALAIRHREHVVHEKLAHRRLDPGDVLLVEVRRDRITELRKESAFIFVSELGLQEFRRNRIMPALLILTAVISGAALGFVSIVVGALAGCVLMILSGCITAQEAYESINWKVLMLLAGTMALGAALEKTGVAPLLSEFLVSSVGQFGPVVLLAVLYLITSLLTEMMSNNATAVIVCPIAIAAAESMGVNARPFLMAVAFGASASFMTPVGYQTNTMIYGPGQYKYVDFLRVGTPLNIILWLLAILLIPRFWPFQ